MGEETKQAVEVEPAVFEGIEAVRKSGLTNMLDRSAVAEITRGFGYDVAATWVRDNQDLYARAVFQEFEVTK